MITEEARELSSQFVQVSRKPKIPPLNDPSHNKKRPVVSGIYGIYHKPTNSCVYIGCSQNIRERWNTHICNLRANRHHHPVLRTLSIEDLSFKVIDVVKPNKDGVVNRKKLLEREARWHKILKSVQFE